MSGTMSDGKPEQPATLQVSESGEVKLEMSPTPPHKDSPTPDDDRDPDNMNDHIKVKFQDIFAEPDSEIYTPDNVWSLGTNVFTKVKFWCYRITSLICVLPLAVCWGCYFACVAFCSVWCCMPCIKSCDIECVCIRKLWQLLMNTCVAPCYEAMGRCLSGIRVTHIKE